MQIIDLTQTLQPGIPDWDGCCGFQIKSETTDEIRLQELATPAGIGTHMDAPAHFFIGGTDIASIDIKHCMGEAIVIDARDKTTPDYFLSVSDIQNFEQQNGQISPQSIVLLLTGWQQYWHTPERYLNKDSSGHRIFPGFSAAAAEYLLRKDINGIGIDTLSPDGSHRCFPVHRSILGAGKYILENLCNLQYLPPRGAQLIALPLKIANGTEAPARVIAMY